MPDPAHTISVMISTRDRKDDLVRCLQSIQSQSVQPTSVVIVSGSPDSCPHDLPTSFPDLNLHIIESFENNISISRNAGIERTQSDLLLFIDDDAIAHPHWIRAYQEHFRTNPDTWAAGGPVFDSRTNPHEHEFNQGMLSPLGTQSPINQSINKLFRKGYKRTVKGCNFAIRRAQILKIGAFDPFFRFAYDEADLIYSIHHANGGVDHCQGAIVDHAHTPGHFRQIGRLAHDWRVEYASHTMFMLKHAPSSSRLKGWLIIYRRLLKLVLTAFIAWIQREVKLARAFGSIREAHAGVREAKHAYHA